MQPSPLRLQGVGGTSESSGFVHLPAMLQHGLHIVSLPVYIMPDESMPRGVDLLLGVDTQTLTSVIWWKMSAIIMSSRTI